MFADKTGAVEEKSRPAYPRLQPARQVGRVTLTYLEVMVLDPGWRHPSTHMDCPAT